tara:strand:+ start:1018 stop:1293 length:276 start_codon:yes stop_codon:yes gene_type:complete
VNWVVIETKKVVKTLDKLPKNIQSAYSYWRHLVIANGVNKLREIKSFHFEKLKGNKQGQYSCRLSKSYRVFFEINKREIKIIVVEVNKHEY